MKVISSKRSPNFTDKVIGVEFLVLHYTATSLERTLDIFLDRDKQVSAHLVIDRDGAVYEVVPCLGGDARRAWHAGRSSFLVGSGEGQRLVEGFNDCSIGIELVNLNGNIYPYTEEQYSALFGVIEQLKGLYPALSDPERVVGHEQVAGFRGKADPGLRFEWQRLYGVCYPQQGAPLRECRCPAWLAERVSSLCLACGVMFDGGSGAITIPQGLPGAFFEELSSLLEGVLGAKG